jgi:hypothetical protein
MASGTWCDIRAGYRDVGNSPATAGLIVDQARLAWTLPEGQARASPATMTESIHGCR